ncbi:MAG TPA: hypothetical protein PLE13_07315 [Solirubrobacterales bacterium]|nr:hypothetical protein [Solirubrobacterales bacterium]
MSETHDDQKPDQNDPATTELTPEKGWSATTRRRADNPVGRWVAVGAAVVVALFSGMLIGRATGQDPAEAGPASFGRPDGDGPPAGGQVPFHGDDDFGGQSYGDDDSYEQPEGGDDEHSESSSGGSSPSPLETGQS